MKDFFPVSRIERIIPEKETKIHVILEHQTGSINVNAMTFSGAYPARFYLNGKLIGKPPLTVEDVTAGAHPYRLEADNHQEISGDVVVSLDEQVKLDGSLNPLPGTVSLKSIPSGAAIWLDGKKSKLRTDVKTKLSLGKHTITLKLDSYVDAEKAVELLPGSDLEEEFRLIKNQGRINVVSIPEGAAIWMDGKDAGKKTDHFLEVLAGKHEVTLKLDGYKDVKKKVSLEPEGFIEVEVRLKKGQTRAAKKSTRGARFIAHNSGMVKDTKTGLEWVVGPDKDTNWEEANSWVAGLKTGGGGWRMPTLDELEGIYEKGLGDRNMTPLLKTTGWWVWSGETKGSSDAGDFDFGSGNGDWDGRDGSIGRAFAVRSRSDG